MTDPDTTPGRAAPGQVAATAPVLVVNAGSSSLKYRLVEPSAGHTLATGLIERIGEGHPRARHTGSDCTTERELDCPHHESAFQVALAAFAEHGPPLRAADLLAVGHRVVHGGSRFAAPVLVDDDVIAQIEALVPLAPLHNPGNLAGLRAARAAFDGIPQVAVFDTAFHQTLPPAAYTYAVPRDWRDRLHVRRYGFHGTSHAYVSRRVADLLGRPPQATNTVVLHLGNGASACAVEGGRSIDTSMGLSPLGGLVMGTRSGDLDPAIAPYLSRHGIPVHAYDEALNHDSGLRALAGSNDFREVMRLVDAGDPDARLAVEVAAYRIAKYVGGYAVALGRLDALAFTGGIGEHSAALRADVVGRLAVLGLELDTAANAAASGESRISTPASAAQVWVVPTDEELEIARHAVAVVRAGHPSA